KPAYQEGKAHTLLAQVETETYLNRNMLVQGKLDYTVVSGEGENIGEHSRKTLAAVLLLKHEVSASFGYGINFRQEFLNDFDNPLLFSADARWQVSDLYALRINGSKNFRIPTFNDLYWNAGGNKDLNPEISYQAELGQEWTFKNFNFDLASIYIDSKDSIRWCPFSRTYWKHE